MIYTVTFNPSVDYIVELDALRTGEVNRSLGEAVYPGGKGINVSIVLTSLGIENTALGFVAGFTGDAIEAALMKQGVKTEFIHLKNGMSRINCKLVCGGTTDINARGPAISDDAQALLYTQLDKLVSGDYLVLAGAIPPSLPDYTYELILERLSDRGIRVVVDASGELLLHTLRFQPFLVKPNKQELEELFCTKLIFKEDIISCARKLRELGAANVIVSLGAEGALLITEDNRLIAAEAPSGIVRNPVGAGDSMVAGFIYGYESSGTYDEAFRTGIAAGSASAFSDTLACKADILALRNRI